MGNTDRQLDNIAQKLDAVGRQVKDVSEKMDRVWTAQQGNDVIGAPGLMNRVKNLESRVRELENFKTRVLFIAAGAAVGSSTLTAAIVRFLLN